MKDKLTNQEKNFVKEVVETGNQTQSAKNAFGITDDNYAGLKGHREIRKDKIQNAIKPIVEQLEKERERIIEALASKDLSEEKYRDLIDGLDKITKNHQLLTGGKTENIGIIPITDLFVKEPVNDIQNSNSNETDSEVI